MHHRGPVHEKEGEGGDAVLKSWKKTILISMCRCCAERVWSLSVRMASCGTSTKMATFARMTGVDHRSDDALECTSQRGGGRDEHGRDARGEKDGR